jgi:hypothetical protein
MPADEQKSSTAQENIDTGFKAEIKDIEYDGYKFKINTDLIDDVEVVDLIDKIENQQNLKAIVDFLQYLVGNDGYEKMKAYFVKKDGRFRLSKLSAIYQAIFENFDPKE